MKVLMLGRLGFLNGSGGDRIQIENTARELKKLNIEVDVSDNYDIDFSPYDLVHIFQLDWAPESYIYVSKSKLCGKKVIFSPIHHNFDEVKHFDNKYPFDFRRVSRVLFKDQYKRDVLKDVYRSVTSPKRIKSLYLSMSMGLKELYTKTLQMSDIILVQTELEASDLEDTFGVDIKWVKIPNGVGEQFINPIISENKLPFENYILSIGRIEPRKNQLNVIKAVRKLRSLDGMDAKLVFIGTKTHSKHFEYTYLFNKELSNNEWITHLEKVPYSDIPVYYRYGKVCVSASWFETTGLTSLEAIFMNTNAVASGSRAREYLGDLASYCSPDDIDSIYDAIKKEYNKKRPEPSSLMRTEYTWSNAAKKTLEVYNSVLNKA